jgi:hypothetical protein
MPCDSRLRRGQTAAERAAEVKKAIQSLEKALAARAVTIVVAANGGILFKGWKDGQNLGVNDACAYRALQQANSWELRQAQARAEALAGRQVNQQMIGQGMHSHDGGHTWGTH